jgi:hypothetical protein
LAQPLPSSSKSIVFRERSYPFAYRGRLPEPSKKYALLTAVEPVGYRYYGKQKRFFFLWNCDCGKTKEYPVKEVLSGNCKSCGCLSYNLNPSGWTKSRNPQLSSWRVLYKQYKSSAAHRSIDFNISLDDFINVASKPCSFCGDGMGEYSKWQEPWTQAKGRFITAQEKKTYIIAKTGVDRINSKIGYAPSNIQPCCKNCNRAKMDLNQKDFLLLVEKIYLHKFCCQPFAKVAL